VFIAPPHSILTLGRARWENDPTFPPWPSAEAEAHQEQHVEGSLADTPEEWMRRYAAGDIDAFEQLYRHLSPKVFGYLLRLTRQRQRAEDLVQITFSKVHRSRHSYLTGAPVLPWLLAIARRSFYDEYRRDKTRPEELSADGALPEPTLVASGLEPDLADALDQALSRLPRTYAEAIELTKVTGLSLAEAAAVLGASKTAVKLRVHRGYVLLRQELEAQAGSHHGPDRDQKVTP